MRKIFNNVKRYGSEIIVLGIIVIILYNIIFFYSFTQQSARLTENANKTQLGEIANQTVNLIKTQTTEMSSFIACAAVALSDYDNLLSEQAMARLRLLNEHSSFNRIRVVLPDYISYGPDGDTADVSMRHFLKDALKGKSGVSSLMSSVISDSNIIIYYTPIYHGDKIVGVLTGAYEVASLSAATNISSFGGNGFASVIELDGDIIITPQDDSLPESGQINAWSLLSEVQIKEGYSLDIIKTNVKNGRSGIFEYTVSGEKKYTYYTPVGVNDWYVLQTVPESVITAQTGYINEISMHLLIKVIGLFVLVIIIIWFYSFRTRRFITNTKLQLDSIVNAVPGGVVKCTDSGDYSIKYVSDGFLNMIGCSRARIKTGFCDNLLGSVHPDDRNRVSELLSRLDYDMVTQLEYRINTHSNNTLWVLNKCLRTIDKTDDTPCLYCVCIDITDSKVIQQTLQLSNERFKMAMSQTSNIVFEYDSVSDRIHFVTKTSSYYNLPLIIENGPSYFVENGIVSDDFTEQFLACFKSISKADTNMVSMILKLKRADGKLVWNKLTLSSIRDTLYNTYRSIGTFEDITQTKEAMLRHKREEKYRNAMLADAITTYEINLTSDRYIKINSSENLFCYDYVKNSYSDILKKLCRKAVYPEDRKLFMSIYSSQNLIKAYENGRLYLYNEYRHLDKNGQAFWISCTTNLLSDPETGDIKAFSYIKDIDSQKRKELAIKHNSERDPLTDLYNRKAAQNLITDNLNNSVETSSTNAYIH